MAVEEGDPDLQALIDLLITQATAQIDGQRQDTGDVDAKALGVLAFSLASVAFLASVGPALGEGWIAVGLLVGFGGVLLLICTWPRDFDSGPELDPFYDAMGGSSRQDSSLQMLSQLVRAVSENEDVGLAKGRAFRWGSAGILGGLALAGVIAFIDSLD